MKTPPRDLCRLDRHEAFVALLLLPSLRDRLLAAAAFAKINILFRPRKQVTSSAVLLWLVFLHSSSMCPLSRHLFVQSVGMHKQRQGDKGESGRRKWHQGAEQNSKNPGDGNKANSIYPS